MAGRFVCFISFQFLVSSLSQMVNKKVLHEWFLQLRESQSAPLCLDQTHTRQRVSEFPGGLMQSQVAGLYPQNFWSTGQPWGFAFLEVARMLLILLVGGCMLRGKGLSPSCFPGRSGSWQELEEGRRQAQGPLWSTRAQTEAGPGGSHSCLHGRWLAPDGPVSAAWPPTSAGLSPFGTKSHLKCHTQSEDEFLTKACTYKSLTIH